ncbi:concanavalin A-like lectin/glucanase domain-containing protein [Sparassis latifolia]|uniref:Probable glycosidase n=1 Tax=Sparassis crispa TaxID=139825 RepID=A0A401H576_9APHY|nr:Probable glycosidase [Sparassis crispa]GBE89585.1 Probable glycosidase [Sparassis crispa]
MRSAFAAALLSLPLAALAGAHDAASFRRHSGAVRSSRRSSTNYTLVDKYVGEDFLNEWQFYDQADPTGGNVNYVSQSAAESAGLAYVDCNNVTVLAVDDTSSVASGGNRDSVRISSPKAYNSGLFIGDFGAMPTGCGVWPAFWLVSTVGPWPAGGEVDIIEGVNLATQNQVTIHTNNTCMLTSNSTATASVINNDCQSYNGHDSGCAYLQDSTETFGAPFNQAGGGVFALQWTSSAFSFFYFPRDSIPADITSETPDPSSWGEPTADFTVSGCDMASSFFEQAIVFDTTICGDWAGPSYPSTCPGSCSSIVANATNFADARWKINSVIVYQ